MPLNQKNELAQVVEESTLPIEHNGGDGWTILHGDTLQIIRAFKPQVFDALITDPPYASGGWKPAEKNRTTTQKYSSMDPKNAPPDFDGDNRDQRSWTRWMAEWLYDARKACKPGAPVCLFIDWRQYPSITDALQWAGWIWRGCVVWDKMTSRPQKGRFRQQSEYVVWGSNGPMPVSRPVGVPLRQFVKPHPCHREAPAAHAGPCENLCAGRKDPRPLLRGRNHRAGSQAGGVRGRGHRGDRRLLQAGLGPGAFRIGGPVGNRRIISMAIHVDSRQQPQTQAGYPHG